MAYRLLLDRYYLTEKPLIIDTKKLARLIGMSNYLDEVNQVLDDFFDLTDDGYENSRCEREINLYQAKASAARVNGQKGGRPRNPEKPRKTQPVILANPTLTQPLTNQEPITNKHIKKINKKEIPPPIDEVISYFCSKGLNQEEAEKFFDYYSSNGWKVSKNPMKCWESAIRSWISRSKQFPDQPINNKNETFGENLK